MRLILFTALWLVALAGFSSLSMAQQDMAVTARNVNDRSLVMERRSPVQFSLTHKETGAPVTPDQLEVVHTEPVHLLIVDPSLEDYHHIHPTAASIAGEYLFMMTPRTACGYRVWVDITLAGQAEQYAPFDIPGAKNCMDADIDKTIVTSYSADGYSYDIVFDVPLQKGRDTMAKVTIRDDKGRLFYGLEPIMGAYAHMVGFYQDYRNIAHIHPMGEEPATQDDRGGPVLEFHIRPEHSGFIKLYAQFYMNGREHFVPFSAIVDDEVSTPAAAPVEHSTMDHSEMGH